VKAELDHNSTENPYKKADEAMEKSSAVLRGIEMILKKNPDFCSEARRAEWLEDIQTLLESDRPQTVIGVLGSTGVCVEVAVCLLLLLSSFLLNSVPHSSFFFQRQIFAIECAP
jgi:hypothetical protein